MKPASVNSANNTSPFWLVIPAAGVGTRLGGDVPKQYCVINGKSILEYTLDAFLGIPGLKGIVIVIHKDDQHFAKLSLANHSLIKTVIGGKERADSVLNALAFLENQCVESDWVLVHDAARPCVLSADVIAMINNLSTSNIGGIMAVPVGDTIKVVGNEGEIVKTEDRRALWQAQTPQMFRLGILQKALLTAHEKNAIVTDEASAIELLGYTPRVFQGKRSNIKITLPEDLTMAESLLRQSV